MGEKGNDDWGFKVEADQSKPELQEKPSAQRPSLKKKVSSPKKEQFDLTLNQKVISKSRSADAREMQAELDEKNKDHDIPMGPNLLLRAQAFVIDIVFCLICVGGVYAYDKMLFKMPRFMGPLIPHDLRSYGDHYLMAISFLFLFYMILVVFFTAVSGRSVGKKLSGIIVRSADESSVHLMQILWRELIVKPVSVISVVGILFYFISGKRRMLHDYLSGTSLFYN